MQDPPRPLLEMIRNLAETHREHEKFYSQAPLRTAADVQAGSRVLKALAQHWSEVTPAQSESGSAYAGAEDLNPPGLIAEHGVLFMEGQGEPAEILRLERDLENIATDMEETGSWLGTAMEQSWGVAGALAAHPALADLLGERHRIIVNDWQAASIQPLVAKLIRRALDLVRVVNFAPSAVREDLDGERAAPRYLYSASELLDRAADLIAESAILVHDNERRWRSFSGRVRELLSDA